MLDPVLLDLPDVLATERLQLRSMRPGDGRELNAAIVESWRELSRWLPWAVGQPQTVEASEQFARVSHAAFLNRTGLRMVMVEPGGARIVGCAGLHRMDWSIPRFEIGYWVRSSSSGQGYATEAVRALTRFAFTELAAARVEIKCSHRNVRSQRVAERCGFVREGSLRNYDRDPDGARCDIVIYALIPEDEATRRLLQA
jgi:RimJ/RimL family protein N-acetyltransferase